MSSLGAPLSAGNDRLRAARKLVTAKGRRAAGRFIAEGAQAAREALRHGRPVQLFATPDAADRHPDLVAAAHDRGARVDLIDDRSAAALSDTSSPQGLLAICEAVTVPLGDALAPPAQLVVAVLDASDPGNAGTILRTADAAGASAMVFAGQGVDPFNGKLVRATAGSLFHLSVVDDVPLDRLLGTARERGFQVLAAAADGAVELDELAAAGGLAGPTIWLMGNEAHGLPRQAIAGADASVRIPIHGNAESLNLSVAAGLCLYASARAQRPR